MYWLQVNTQGQVGNKLVEDSAARLNHALPLKTLTKNFNVKVTNMGKDGTA